MISLPQNTINDFLALLGVQTISSSLISAEQLMYETTTAFGVASRIAKSFEARLSQ